MRRTPTGSGPALLLLALLLGASPASAYELLQNDSFQPGDGVAFYTYIGSEESFAAIYEVPDDHPVYRVCRVIPFVGPDSFNIYTLRLGLAGPDGGELGAGENLIWQSDQDAFQVFGSPNQLGSIDLSAEGIVTDVRRLRVQLRVVSDERSPNIAMDDDGITPERNYVRVRLRNGQNFIGYTEGMNPAGTPPGATGDWILRTEIVHPQEDCPDPGALPPDAGPDEVFDVGLGQDDGGVDAGPDVPIDLDAGVDPPEPDGAVDAAPDRAVEPDAAPDTGGEVTGDDAGVTPAPDRGAVDGDRGVGPGDEPLALARISPEEGPASANTDVLVNGRGFLAGGGITRVELGERRLLEPTALSSSTLLAVVPVGLEVGVWDLRVIRADGQVAVLRDAFTVYGEPLRLESIEPDRINAGAPAELTIRGAGFTADVEFAVAATRLEDVALDDDGRTARGTLATPPAPGTYDLVARRGDEIVRLQSALTVSGGRGAVADGCRAAPGAPTPAGWLWGLWALGLLGSRRRRAGAGRAGAGLLAAAAVVGCACLLSGCDDDTASVTPSPDARVVPDAPDAALDLGYRPGIAVYYVELGAVGGDGTRDKPFGDPAEAYAIAEPKDIVLLLPGVYHAPALPPPGVVLSGTGPEVTTIVGPLTIDTKVILRGVTIEAGDPVVYIAEQGRLDLQEAVLSAPDAVAVHLHGRFAAVDTTVVGRPALHVEPTGTASTMRGAVTVSPGFDSPVVVNRGFTHLASTAITARGPVALDHDGETLMLYHSTVEGAAVGVQFAQGYLSISGGWLRGVSDPGGNGAGVRMVSGLADVVDVTFEDFDRGLRIDRGAEAFLDDVVIRDPATDGISIQGGDMTARHLLITDPGNAGIAAIEFARMHLRDIQISRPGRIGMLVDESMIDLERLIVEDSAARGVSLLGAIGLLRGLDIRNAANVGVQITGTPSAVRVTDSHIQGCGTSGLSIVDVESQADPWDGLIRTVVVEGTTPGEFGLADGVHIYRSTNVGLRFVSSHDNAGAGIIYEQASGDVIGGVLSGNQDAGLVVLSPVGPLQSEDVVIRDNGGAGVLAIDGETGFLRGSVSETRVAAGIGPGHGFYATGGGHITVVGAVTRENAGSGVAFDPATGGSVSAVQALDNGGYGLLVACGAVVDEPSPNVLEGNGLGARATCDR